MLPGRNRPTGTAACIPGAWSIGNRDGRRRPQPCPQITGQPTTATEFASRAMRGGLRNWRVEREAREGAKGKCLRRNFSFYATLKLRKSENVCGSPRTAGAWLPAVRLFPHPRQAIKRLCLRNVMGEWITSSRVYSEAQFHRTHFGAQPHSTHE